MLLPVIRQREEGVQFGQPEIVNDRVAHLPKCGRWPSTWNMLKKSKACTSAMRRRRPQCCRKCWYLHISASTRCRSFLSTTRGKFPAAHLLLDCARKSQSVTTTCIENCLKYLELAADLTSLLQLVFFFPSESSQSRSFSDSKAFVSVTYLGT